MTLDALLSCVHADLRKAITCWLLQKLPCPNLRQGTADPQLPPPASLPWLLLQLLPQLLLQLGQQPHPETHVLSPATAACSTGIRSH